MAASYTYTCYLIDCSPSMGRPLDEDSGLTKTRLEYALEFVRVKLAQRLINPKKTDQIAIVTFGGERTLNALAHDGKEGYDNIEEVIPMRMPSYADIRNLDNIKVGQTDVDLVAAMYVAGNVVRNAKVARKDAKKQVVLLTDAEEPVVKQEDGSIILTTEWQDDGWIEPLYKAIVPGLASSNIDWKELFTLGVIGMDFGEPDVDEQYKDSWSEAKSANVAGLMAFVNKVNELAGPTGLTRALLGSILSATAGASAPAIAPIKTVNKTTQLIIGDVDEAPEQTLAINVMVQKATQKAAAKSMQKMRRGVWKKNLSDPIASTSLAGKKRNRNQEEEEDDDEEAEDRTTLHDPGAIVPEKQWYHVEDFNKDAKKPKADGEEEEEEDSEDEIEKAKRSEESRRLETDENLSRAYKYGSDLIPISKEEEQDFYQFPAGEPALMVRGFVKAKDFHPEWALGDPYWLFGGDDSRSQLALSGLLWALKESGSQALVRMLLPKIAQPRVCLLLPEVGEEAVDDRMEMGLLVPMPFSEEIANWSFPSLDRVQTVSGKALTEHRLLPKPNLLSSMDSFVDSMMLPVYSNEEEPQEADQTGTSAAAASTTPWFDANESYNPAIHNMRNCIIHKLLHPSETITDDLEVHPALSRYMFPPDETMSSSAGPAAALLKDAGLSLVPPKPKMTRGRGRKKQAQKPSKTALEELMGEDTTMAVDDEATQSTQPWMAQSQRLYRPNTSFAQSQSQSQGPSRSRKEEVKTESPAAVKKGKTVHKTNGDSSATEESDTETDDAASTNGNGKPDIDGVQTGRAKPSLLDYDDPIPDFEKLVKQAGMMTSQAMRQMCEIIPTFIDDAKTEKDMQKPRDCIVHARRAAIEEDESVLFNKLLHTVKEMLSKPGAKHSNFMKRLEKENLGLVTRDESKSHHGDPDALEGAVTAKEADEFWK